MGDSLFLARSACDMMMRKFEAEKLPPEGHFHYHQGVFLSGMYRTYEICKEEKYFNYIKAWVDSLIDKEGNISGFNAGQLDDFQPGILLFPLYEQTGDVRYKIALQHLKSVIKDYPRNEMGGFWHKAVFPDQMWLDGLYMGGPVFAEYGSRFQCPEMFDMVEQQVSLMAQMTRDEKTGLWYHAADYSKKADWADPGTGKSSEFWGRSVGWVPVAILDDLDYFPEHASKGQKLRSLVTELLQAVCRYQSEDGRWYQVLDKPQGKGNWLENSCSSLFVAALCKAVRKGLLNPKYLEYARKGYQGVIDSLEWKEDDIQIGQVCVGTGVGDYQFYCDRPASVNDLHGVGAFLLMCTEIYQVEEKL